jgi:hypothetical protein
MRFHLQYTLLLMIPAFAHAQWRTDGYLQLQAAQQRTDARNAPWQSGGLNVQGFGRGAEAEARFGLHYDNQAQEGLSLRAHISGLARAATETDLGRGAGLLEAFVDLGDLDIQGWRLRLGQSFAGTSQENVESFWQTPHSLSLSALNSWIGEEFRPIGLGLSKRWLGTEHSYDLEAQVYQGNDTGPAVLAWRGFALHNRLSVYGEALPLPPLQTLADGTAFGAQRDVGTQPFGPDLDSRLGYSLRWRARGESLSYSLFATNNRGDQDLHDGDEYSWRNRFVLGGLSWQIDQDWSLLAETLHGRTNMGFAPGPNVQAAYRAHYLMLSRSWDSYTASVRLDDFRVRELDFTAEANSQAGKALTLALLRQLGNVRFGIEYQFADINRPANAEISRDTRQGGSQLQLLARWYFGEE